MRRRAALALLLVPLLGAWTWTLPSWSIVGALRPAIRQLDEDADGRLDAAEMARGSPVLVRFHEIDRNEDGELTEPELLRHVLAEDPADFTGGRQQHLPQPDERFLYFPDPKPVRVLRTLFEFMAVEARAADPIVPLPRYQDMVAAARTGTLASPESQIVAANLVAAWQETGLTVPACLAGIAPVPAAPHDPAEDRAPETRRPRGPRPRFEGGFGPGRPPGGGRPRGGAPPPSPAPDAPPADRGAGP